MAFFRDEGLLNFNPDLAYEEELERARLANSPYWRAAAERDRRNARPQAIGPEHPNLGPQPTYNRPYRANEFKGIQSPPMAAPTPSRMSGPTPGDHHPPVMNTGGFKMPSLKVGSDALLEMSAMIAAAEPPPVQPAPNFKTRMGTRPIRAWNAGPPSSALAPTGERQLKTPISSAAIDSTASARNKKLEELLYGVS
jgi:hypothetical protein